VQRARFLLWLDGALLLAFVTEQAPRPTGLPVHEWLGLALAPLLGLHLVVNWRWITRTLRRLRDDRRRARVNAALNLALYLLMLVTLFSGVAISEVVLPLTGIPSSDLGAWRRLHDSFADFTLILVGLHLAMNWDWIANAVRAMRRPRTAPERRSLLASLGLDDLRASSRRVALLTLVTAALCGGLFAWVNAAGTARFNRRASRRWASPVWQNLPVEIGVELLLLAGIAIVGKRVLRLKL
jgi:cytochrome b561